MIPRLRNSAFRLALCLTAIGKPNRCMSDYCSSFSPTSRVTSSRRLHYDVAVRAGLSTFAVIGLIRQASRTLRCQAIRRTGDLLSR